MNKREILKQTLTKDKLTELYINNNMRVIEIANQYNISRDTILRIIKEYNIIKPKSDAFKLTKESMIKKYGVDNPMKNHDIKIKAEETCLKKYGAKAIILTDEMIQKRKDNINQIKSSYIKNNLPFELYEYFKTKESAIQYIKDNDLIGKTIKDLADFTGYKYSSMVEIVHDLELKDYITVKEASSYYEDEIVEYLKSIGCNNIQQHKRNILASKQELDIYLPDNNIAIEFNGNYWHSDICKDKKYHFNKSKECEESGIRLIHIYQYEWDDERIQPIIKSLLKISLGKADGKIYARKCEVREITNKEAKPFNDKNHIQHHRNAEITYGLYYNDELVQLMSFSHHKQYEWEIVRGCPGSNNIVIGGVSKLFNYFIEHNNPNEIFSYCDYNKFDGSGYLKIGMNYIGTTDPDKTWIMNGKAVKRNPAKYAEYKKKSDGIIWGAGSKKYLWKR